MRSPLRRTVGSWRYVPGDGRDLRIDFLRGYLIFVMVVDHIRGGSWLHALTGGDRFVVSAAEGFVFVSGLVMGMVFQRLIHRDGLGAALRKLLQRGAKLYVVHAILTLGFTASSGLAGAPWYEPVEDRSGYIVGVLTLHRTYYLTDVIHLYVVLVLAAPVALLLLARGHTLAVLLGSGLLWAAYRRFPWELSSLTANVAFPAAAWQIFFFSGLALGYHRLRASDFLSRLPRRPALLLLGGGAAALSAQHLSGGTLFLADGLAGQSYQQLFHKWDVAPGRLIGAAIFFPLAYLLVTALWRPLLAGLGWALLPLGQNSLLAYSLQLPVALMAVAILPLIPGFEGDDPVTNGLAQLGAVALVWGSVKGRPLLSRVLDLRRPFRRVEPVAPNA